MTSPNYIAGGNINPSTFVKIDTSANNQVIAATAGDFVVGIAQEGAKLAPIPGASTLAATSGDPIRVYGLGQVCLLKAGTAGWTRGDLLKSDASGQGVTASTADHYGAVALESATNGALGRVAVAYGTL